MKRIGNENVCEKNKIVCEKKLILASEVVNSGSLKMKYDLETCNELNETI